MNIPSNSYMPDKQIEYTFSVLKKHFSIKILTAGESR